MAATITITVQRKMRKIMLILPPITTKPIHVQTATAIMQSIEWMSMNITNSPKNTITTMQIVMASWTDDNSSSMQITIISTRRARLRTTVEGIITIEVGGEGGEEEVAGVVVIVESILVTSK